MHVGLGAAWMLDACRPGLQASHQPWHLTHAVDNSRHSCLHARRPLHPTPLPSPSHLPAGYCGLDQVEFDLDAPVDALAGTDQSQLLDISLYCAKSVPNAVLVLLGLGCILRLLTALALAYVPRGLRLQPVLQAVAHMCGWGRRQRRRAQRQAAAAAVPAPGREPVRRSATP